MLHPETIGFSNSAWDHLQLHRGASVGIGHAPVVESLSAMRKKVYGNTLNAAEITNIVGDIAGRRYSDIEIASFLTACAGGRLEVAEITALTRAMVESGNQIQWREFPKVFDKHCVGGLPGNRTTPIVVAIASSAGLPIPKTSSRAITSPAGTADTMEVLTDVDLSLEQMRAGMAENRACLAWGGKMNLSPVDDLMIRVERALDLDGEGQLVASVLSKKIAAGSTHVLIDLPVGPTAKVRTAEQANRLASVFQAVGDALGIHVRCIRTDGTQAVGNGVGPAQEARDVLAVLQNRTDAPDDLRERSLRLASELLAMANGGDTALAERQARDILDSGRAWQQFQRICRAQGGIRDIPKAPYHRDVHATHPGTVTAMDNRRLARLAKLAGAPTDAVAGLRLHAKIGTPVAKGHALLTLFADNPGELDYATDYYRANRDIFTIEETP